MNNSPLISVIVPAYNAGKWLRECVDSVIAQTYQNWELIIVDDGSTDDTLQIAEQMMREQKKVTVIHTENGGVCRARNYGVDFSKGEYIAFLDADDLLVQDALEKLYLNLVLNVADISIGWKTNMRSDGSDIGCPYNRAEAIWTQTQALEQSLLDHPATYAVWGKLYRKTIVNNIRFVEGKKVHEDSFFVFQCFLKQPKVVLIKDIVLRYRLSENSASRADFSNKFLDILFFAEEKRHIINDLYPQYVELAENITVKANMALLRTLLKIEESSYCELEKRCIKFIKENKKYFRPAINSDKKWFGIIVHGFYPIYKWVRKVLKKK